MSLSRSRLKQHILSKLLNGEAERPTGYLTRAERKEREQAHIHKKEILKEEKREAERQQSLYREFMKLPIERKEYFKELAKNEIGQKANHLPEIYINLKAAELALMRSQLNPDFQK